MTFEGGMLSSLCSLWYVQLVEWQMKFTKKCELEEKSGVVKIN